VPVKRTLGKRAIRINMHSIPKYTSFAPTMTARTAAYDENRDRFQS